MEHDIQKGAYLQGGPTTRTSESDTREFVRSTSIGSNKKLGVFTGKYMNPARNPFSKQTVNKRLQTRTVMIADQKVDSHTAASGEIRPYLRCSNRVYFSVAIHGFE